MISEDIIKEAASRGIVPGARIKDSASVISIVAPTDKWELSIVGNVLCDEAGLLWAVDYRGGWATVLAPPVPKPQTLEPGMACICGPAMRAAIMERAKELGLWHIDGTEETYSPAKGMWLMSDSSLTHDGLPKVFYWDGILTSKTLPVHEFLRLMESYKPPVKELTTEEKLAEAVKVVHDLINYGHLEDTAGRMAFANGIAFLKSIKP